MRRCFRAALLLIGMLCVAGDAASSGSAPVTVTVDPMSPTKPFPHFWKRCFGSGHAALALRADWQQQLQQIRNELGVERVRFHGIFDDDVGVVLHEPGRFEFFNVDQIYGPMLRMGVKPIVELSFMPGHLANCAPWVANQPPCQTVMHYKGIVQPPTNYSQWTALVEAFAEHLVTRFGREEVRSWHFEVWNELWGMAYPHPYLDLYDASRVALKRVDPHLQIGGPVTMQCQFIEEFTQDRKGKFDFVATHLYPTDPNCTVPGNDGFGDIDCFANTIKRARGKAPADKPFFLTEYNAGLFEPWLLYSHFAAAFIFRNVPQLYDVLDIWSYWTFTDIFEESGMHSAPFEGFNYGIQTNRGIKKPVYRAFELLNRAGSDIYAETSVAYDGAAPPVNATVTAFATRAPLWTLEDNVAVQVFVSNFAPQGYAIQQENVTVALNVIACPQAAAGSRATVYYIDTSNANAFATWKAMGSPAYPTDEQLAQMEVGSRLVAQYVPIRASQTTGNCEVQLTLNTYAAALVEFSSLV